MSTATLPGAFYTAAQVRELDRLAIEEQGVPGDQLMDRAGHAAWQAIQRAWPRLASLAVFCGSGNNGGDGYVVARLAADQGVAVTVYQKTPLERLQGSAHTMAERALATPGVTLEPLEDPPETIPAELIVDALLGTGLSGTVRDDYGAVINTINASGLPVFSADIPSGLCADTGRVLGTAVRANQTLTFIGVKAGLLTGAAPAHCGHLAFDDLQVPPIIFESMQPAGKRLTPALLREQLPPRARDAHKGHFGHVLVVGGDRGLGGAAIMAARAAARAGAGLVSVATRAEHLAAVLTAQPEIMAHPVADPDDLDPLLAQASVVVLGPGLGRDAWGWGLWRRVLRSGRPRVLDADALNLLAREPDVAGFREQVLTPHPGEAARLLGADTADIQASRFATVQQLQQRHGGAAILKGAGSLVYSGPDEPLGLCTHGNPGMASGGMGDLLSGLTGGLRAQGLTVGAAARLATLLHARAADLAAEADGERGLLATDLLPWIRPQINGDTGAN